MPIKQLRVVEKIKFLVSSKLSTKKQIMDEAQKNAKEHRQANQTQEREDDSRVEHATKELHDENRIEDKAYSRTVSALGVSIFINFILLVVLILVLVSYLLFYR